MRTVFLVIFADFSRYFVPALALGYLKAFAYKYELIRKNFNIKIVNCDLALINEDYSKDIGKLNIIKTILRNNPEIIGFSCYSWNLEATLKTIQTIKNINPDAKIWLGGPAATSQVNCLLKNKNIEIVVCGSGEETFRDLLYVELNKIRKEKVKGIAYMHKEKIIFTGERGPLADLDEIPSPYLQGYLNINKEFHWLETFRGCKFNCAYCGYPRNKLSYFSIERIRKEIEFAASNNVKKICFIMDSAINLDMKRLKLISQMIKSINRNGDIEFSCEAFAEFANKDCAHYLKDMNTESVELGLQTVNPEALKNVSRFFHPEKFKQGCSNLREKKLKFHIGILNGLPGDNFEWVKKTFEFAKQCAPTSISSSIVSVDPATKLHREAAKFKLKFEKVPMYRALSSYSYSFFELCKMQQYLITEIEKYNQSQVKLNSLTS